MNSPIEERRDHKGSDTGSALELDPEVFTYQDPKRIAEAIKQAAENSRRRRAEPFRSAMSVLTFYINKEGEKLPPGQRERLERAKDELRELFGRPRRKVENARRKREEAEPV